MRTCPNCGHALDDRDDSPNCPACGREFTVSDVDAATINFTAGDLSESLPKNSLTVVEAGYRCGHDQLAASR